MLCHSSPPRLLPCLEYISPPYIHTSLLPAFSWPQPLLPSTPLILHSLVWLRGLNPLSSTPLLITASIFNSFLWSPSLWQEGREVMSHPHTCLEVSSAKHLSSLLGTSAFHKAPGHGPSSVKFKVAWYQCSLSSHAQYFVPRFHLGLIRIACQRAV